MASRYWVGGGSSDAWNATGPTNWSATSGGANDASVPGSTDDVFFNGSSGSGNATISANITIKSIDCTGYTGTITHDASVTLTIAGGSGTSKLATGMTYTFGSSTTSIIATNTSHTFWSQGRTLPTMTGVAGAGAWTLGDNWTCSGSVKGMSTLNAQSKSLTCFSLESTSSYNLQGTNLTLTGTGTILVSAGFFVNTDASTVITVTDTSGATKQILNDTTNVCPGTIQFGAGAAGTFQIPGNNELGTIDFTNFTGTWADNGASGLSLQGSLTLGSSMTNSYTQQLTFKSTSTANIVSNGKAFDSNFTFNGTGTFSLTDHFSTTGTVTHTKGTLTLNDKNMTCASLDTSNANTRTLTLGSGTLTLTGTGTVFNAATTTNLTVSATTGTIKINDASATGKTFAGGGKTYGNLTFEGTGSGTLTITGANTFTTFALNNAPKSVVFPASATTTVTTANFNGSAGNLNVLRSSSGGTAATLSAGTANVDYCDVGDMTAAGAASPFTTHFGTNSTGNTNWNFISVTPHSVTKSDQYAVSAEHAVTKSDRYAIESSGSETASLRYSVSAQAAATKSLTYRVIVPGSVTAPSGYAVAISAAETKTETYAVKTQGSISDGLRYEVITTAAVTKGSAYAVAVPSDETKSNRYAVRTSVVETKGLAYAVTSPAAENLAEAYRVRTVHEITKQVRYAARTEGAETKSLAYEMVSRFTYAVTISSRYAVAVPTDEQKADTYRVKANASVGKEIAYRLKTSGSVTVGSQYDVAPETDIIKGLAYSIKSPVAVELSGQYATRSPKSTSKAVGYGIVATGAITVPAAYGVHAGGTVHETVKYTLKTSQNVMIALGIEYAIPGQIAKAIRYAVATSIKVRLACRYETEKSPYSAQGPVYMGKTSPFAAKTSPISAQTAKVTGRTTPYHALPPQS